MRLLVAALLVAFTGPAAAEPDYFPLREHATWRWSWSYEGRGGDETQRLERLIVDGRPVFYFTDKPPEASVISIGPQHLGVGGYERRADGVYTIAAYWLSELPKTVRGDAQLLLPRQLEKNARVVVHEGFHDIVITVVGFEDVSVPAGRFARCLKLSVDAEGRGGTAWLAPGVGLVQWWKHTGRRQVLVAYHVE